MASQLQGVLRQLWQEISAAEGVKPPQELVVLLLEVMPAFHAIIPHATFELKIVS